MRKTSSVVLETTDGQDNKIVLDNVPDNTMNMDDVRIWLATFYCTIKDALAVVSILIECPKSIETNHGWLELFMKPALKQYQDWSTSF